MGTIFVSRWHSPVGELELGGLDGRLCLCDWVDSRRGELMHRRLRRVFRAEIEEGRSDVVDGAIMELTEYFGGTRRRFDVPLLFAGTDFQRRVWEELVKVPFGTTISYGELAQRVGASKAYRAVATCNATNPLSIFVPCHRVIGSDNRLTGYGGGLDVKDALLRHEGISLPLMVL